MKFSYMRQFAGFLLPYWKKGVIPVLYLVVSTIISFSYPLFPKWAIDDVVTGGQTGKLPLLAGVFLILVISQRVFSYLNEVTFFKFQKTAVLNIQKDLIKKVFYYPMEFFDKNHSGYLLGRIRGDVAGVSYIFSESLIMVLMDFIKFFGAAAILATMNFKLTLIAMAIIPFLVFKITRSKSNIKEINTKVLEQNARLTEEISDALQGIEVFKSFSKEEEGIYRTQKGLSDYQEVEVRRKKVLSAYRNIVDLIVHLGEVLLLYFGIKEVLAANLSLGDYFAFTGYLVFLYSPMRNLGNFSISMDFAKRSYDRLKELFDMLPEENGKEDLKRIQKIEIKDLHFAYNGKEKIIQDLSFDISRGDRILLMGESGSGKSTLIKLLMGLYRPNQGEILYNGILQKEIDMQKFREQVGYISQNIFLFNKSLRENITLNKKNFPDSELMTLLKECKLDHRVQEFQEGLNEMISEKGVNFSGGEKQRIALVRALIKKPELIIIDEGTSNLDRETEKEILETIERNFKESTIIRVTHREVKDPHWKRIKIKGFSEKALSA